MPPKRKSAKHKAKEPEWKRRARESLTRLQDPAYVMQIIKELERQERDLPKDNAR